MEIVPAEAIVAAGIQLVPEINACHSQVVEHCNAAEAQIGAALTAAWHAGGLLRTAKQQVRECMGHGVWSAWLGKHFAGSERTAQRYMQLAKSVTAVSDLRGLSLRQAYQRLGLRVEQRGAVESIELPKATGPGSAARRLLAKLPTSAQYGALSDSERERLLHDLAPLHSRLRELFTTG